VGKRAKTVRWILAGASLAATLCCSATTRASPTYPGLIPGDVKALTGTDMPCTPPCTLCHRDLQGGRGTVVQPFGRSMIARGLTYQDPESLARALGELHANSVDSDGDGVPDITETSLGNDPNAVAGSSLCTQTPAYGCGAHVARQRPRDLSAAAVLGLGVLALCLAIRRNRGGALEDRRTP